ncbi:MAG: hypothetical protein ACKVVP_13730 [Chloroflexota bacterium]
MSSTTIPLALAPAQEIQIRGHWLARLHPAVEALLMGLAFTAWSFAFRGFDGGRWSDIPIFKSFMDPRLYTRDPFISALHEGTPAAYTYAFVGALARLLGGMNLDAVLLFLFIPASVVSLAVLYQLARDVVGNRLAAGLFLLFYIASFRLLTIGSTILHSAETTPAFLALPFQVGGLLAAFRGRHWLAGLLIGIGLNVHAPTTILVALGIGAVWLALIPRIGMRQPLVSGLVLLLAGAPAVIGSIGQHTDALPLWALYLAKAELATDISTTVAFETWHLRLRNLLGAAFLLVAFMSAPPRKYRIELLALTGGCVLMCLAAVAFFDLSLKTPLSTMVARLQFPRSVWLVNVFGLMLVAALIVQAWRTGLVPRWLLGTLAAALLLSPRDFIPWEPIWPVATCLFIGMLAMQRIAPGSMRLVQFGAAGILISSVSLVGFANLSGRRINDIDISQGILVSALAMLLITVSGLIWRSADRPAGQRAGMLGAVVALSGTLVLARYEGWQFQRSHAGGLRAAEEFQTWARTGTPLESVFLTLPSEPNNDNFYKLSDRALFLVRERANQAVYFPRHNDEFRLRLEALGIDDPVAYKADLDRAYRRIEEPRLRELARNFGVTHFVPARNIDLPFPIVYRSGGWTVYEISP